MKNAGKACNNRLYRHIRTFEKIVKNYFVILGEMSDENQKKTITMFLLNTFYINPYDTEQDFYPQFYARLDRIAQVIA